MCIKPYEIDLDENGMLKFTKKNIDIINCCINIDSIYRHNIDTNYKGSSANLISNCESLTDYDKVLDICKAINNENRTHATVSGNTKGSNNGLIQIAEYIKNNATGFYIRLRKNDKKLATELATLSVKGRNNISFASKFCAYYARYKFGNDFYIKYDSVVSEILPYYAWKYFNETEHIKNKKSIYTDRSNYARYCKLINRLIEEIKNVENLKLSHDEFDRMLWYYYKGDKQLRNDAIKNVVDVKKRKI